MRKAIAIVAAAALVACQDSTGPQLEFGNASIGKPTSSKSVVALSEQPKVNAPIELTVNTFGYNGCWGRTRTELIATEQGAIIIPYNGQLGNPRAACLSVEVEITHRVSLTFRSPGTKTITVLARDYETGANRQVDVSLTVTP